MGSVALVGKDPNATAAHWRIDYKILVVSFSEMHGRRTTPHCWPKMVESNLEKRCWPLPLSMLLVYSVTQINKVHNVYKRPNGDYYFSCRYE